MKLEIGTEVTLTRSTYGCFIGRKFPLTVEIVENHEVESDGLYGVSVPGETMVQWVDVSSVEYPKSENRSRLVLMKAEFKDGDGNTITIKRSKCRHYYIKEATSNQKRVSLEEIAAYLSDASCDLV